MMISSPIDLGKGAVTKALISPSHHFRAIPTAIPRPFKALAIDDFTHTGTAVLEEWRL